jgi:hypothetical protein
VNLFPQLGEPLQQALDAALLIFHPALQRHDAIPRPVVAEDQPDHTDRENRGKALHGL